MYNKVMHPIYKRWPDWFTALAVISLFLIAVTRLGLTNWADNLEIAGWLLLLGAILGYLLGLSKLHWVYSIFASIFLSCLAVPLSFLVFLSNESKFIDRVIDIWSRILVAGRELIANQPVSDSIIFLIAMGALFWILGLSTGFSLVRNAKPWVPLIFLGIAVLLIEHYQPQPRKTFYSWIYAITLVIILGRVYFLRIRDSFRDKGKRIGNDTEFDFMRGVVICAFAVGIAAWMMPGIVHVFISDSPERTRLTQRWEVLTGNFENLFYALDESANTIEESTADDMALGTGQILGKEEVLYIQTYLKSPIGYPFYWRGKVFDIYQNGRWFMGSTYKQKYRPSQSIHDDKPGEGQIALKVWVNSKLPSLVQLYTAGEVQKFNRTVDGSVSVQTIQDPELLAFYAIPEIRYDEIYRFESILSIPTSQQLREAGTQYPEWVTERYLQLPDDISNRLVDLGRQLTEKQETPYDKVTAVTLYLRQKIEYQYIIPAPPKKQDPVDWFLFDYQKGFCNYSASAEVLLLRSAGVPARLAVGYAQGTATNTGTDFVIRKENSHAWPEVYFPGFGWIPFEPTSSLPYSDRLTDSSAINQDETIGNSTTLGYNSSNRLFTGEDRANRYLEEIGGIGDETVAPWPKLTLFGKVIIGLLISSLIAVLTIMIVRIKKDWLGFQTSTKKSVEAVRKYVFRIPFVGYWLRSLKLPTTERNFLVIEKSLIFLGKKVNTNDTAQELTERLSEILPAASDDICFLLEQFHRAAYGEIRIGKNEQENKAKRNILSLTWKRKIQQIKAKINRFG